MGALSPWRPFRELERLSRDLEERFHFPRLFERWPFEDKEHMLPIESYVKDGTLVVKADMPGIDSKDVEISVLGNVLTIRGERKEDKEIKDQDYVRRETSYGSFERRMTLPEGVAAEKIKASFKDGVVEVTMPMTKGAAPRKIPLETEPKK
jgi:HSP20 family protein